MEARFSAVMIRAAEIDQMRLMKDIAAAANAGTA